MNVTGWHHEDAKGTRNTKDAPNDWVPGPKAAATLPAPIRYPWILVALRPQRGNALPAAMPPFRRMENPLQHDLTDLTTYLQQERNPNKTFLVPEKAS